MKNENITALCEHIEKTKTMNYPIENSYLVETTDFVRNLYLKMLAVIIQQSEDVKNEQTMLFERIVIGSGSEQSVQEYYRQALEISTDDYDNFCKQFKNEAIKYRFVVDALVLTTMVEYNDEQIKLLAGVMESLGLNKQDVEYLSALSKSIICQNDEEYELADSIKPLNIDCQQFVEYINNYRVVLRNNEDRFEAVSTKQKDIELSELGPISENYLILNNKNVVIKNLSFDLSKNSIKLENNECVDIWNCNFLNGRLPVSLNGCEEVNFYNCNFIKFKSRTIYENKIIKVNFYNCTFVECEYQYSRNSNDWERLGGVIYCSGYENGNNLLKDSEFINCGGRNDRNYYSSAIISNCNVSIENCKFNDCWNYHLNEGYHIARDDRHTLFYKVVKNDNNDVINSAKLM